MASKEWERLFQERWNASKVWEKNVADAKAALKLAEENALAEERRYSDMMAELECSKCWQEGWIDAINEDDKPRWCDCEHGREAKEAAEEANLNAALESRAEADDAFLSAELESLEVL